MPMPWLPTKTKITHLFPVVEQSLPGVLFNLTAALEEFEIEFPKAGFIKLFEIINEDLKGREIGEVDAQRYKDHIQASQEGSPGDKLEMQKAALISACVFASFLKRYLYEGDLTSAWLALCRFEHHYGLLEGLCYPLIQGKRKRASTGGQTKAKRQNALNSAIIELLTTRSPAKGWQSIREAADNLTDHLLASKPKGVYIPPARNDLVHRISNRISEDKATKAAFEANRRLR